uniref:Uncharacterized protein n=1 Tax=Opuntia streptacantha TaxID=393608 RepID=A0A7C8YAE7_OPUST
MPRRRSSRERSNHRLELLSEFNYAQEHNPVNRHHPYQNSKVYPFGVAHLHLPKVSQHFLPCYSSLPSTLTIGKCEPLKLVLVEPLVCILVERDIVHGVPPKGLRKVIRQAEEPSI